MRRPTRLLALATSVAAAALLAGCASTPAESAGSDSGDDTTITIGFNPGPYLEMFQGGIQPILEAEGYTIETADFTDGVIVNVALSDGEIDANIMQHTVYMDAINAQEGLSNAALVQVPTPPMGLFGGKKDSLDDLGTGSSIAVPNQPSNQYRALKVLEGLDLITLSDTIDPATASLQDVVDNPHDIQFVEMENAQQVAALQDVDYSVIQGNFIVSGGLVLTDALALEDLTDEFSVIVTVDEQNVDAEWAQAIKAAYESDEFAEFIAADEQYDGYNLPAAQGD
ncbi:MetQ/NlpA family ABC transporter substrate-binding protein [Microbacterium sp. CIAB417]|uniref:MetQ/NlpA family ABC transporter substrate-binding protein n=1 Tax=Microbacterium sp. CIAB417 TaxID=2860287 RepID=UPI001FAD4390|nr:MetQ/NlpA family ABC transporter substrate-binding protein [Microbacterium sp. CIAB417]